MQLSQGDSGGPANCYHNGKWYVVGVASWVQHCHESPTVYARTSYFIDWIEKHMAWYDDRITCGTKPEQQDFNPEIDDSVL